MFWTAAALRIRWNATAMLVVGQWSEPPLSHPLGSWWIGAGSIIDPAALPWPISGTDTLDLAVPQHVFPPGIDFAVQAVGTDGASPAYRLRTQ